MQVGKMRHPRQLCLSDSASGLQGGAQDQIFSRNLLQSVFLFHLEQLAGGFQVCLSWWGRGEGPKFPTSNRYLRLPAPSIFFRFTHVYIASTLESQLWKSCLSFGEIFLGWGVKTIYFLTWILTDSSGRLGKTDSD